MGYVISKFGSRWRRSWFCYEERPFSLAYDSAGQVARVASPPSLRPFAPHSKADSYPFLDCPSFRPFEFIVSSPGLSAFLFPNRSVYIPHCFSVIQKFFQSINNLFFIQIYIQFKYFSFKAKFEKYSVSLRVSSLFILFFAGMSGVKDKTRVRIRSLLGKIFSNSNSHLEQEAITEIGAPYGASHNVHVGFDGNTFTGLPQAWMEILRRDLR